MTHAGAVKETPVNEPTDASSPMQVVPLEYVDKIIHRMEYQLIETLENDIKKRGDSVPRGMCFSSPKRDGPKRCILSRA